MLVIGTNVCYNKGEYDGFLCRRKDIFMKYCSSCGAEMHENAAVCVKCGGAMPDPAAPAGKLKTNKGLFKYIVLSILTLGIYGLVVMSSVGESVNLVAGRYDGKKTMHFCLLYFLVAPLTLGIAGIVWYHRVSNRIGKELRRRQVDYSFSAADFWLWNVLGALIIIGPFVYYHKLFKATNRMCADYNARG